MPNRLRGSRLARAPRRLTSWQVGPGETGARAFTGDATNFFGAISAATEDGLTVVRLRGECLLMLKTADAATAGFTGAIGVGTASVDATTVGISAVPNPIDDEDWDGWLWHRYFSLASGAAIAAGVSSDDDIVNAVSAVLRIEVDSKAMRKLPENMAVYAAIQVVEAGAATMSGWFNSRLLVKLP